MQTTSLPESRFNSGPNAVQCMLCVFISEAKGGGFIIWQVWRPAGGASGEVAGRLGVLGSWHGPNVRMARALCLTQSQAGVKPPDNE